MTKFNSGPNGGVNTRRHGSTDNRHDKRISTREIELLLMPVDMGKSIIWICFFENQRMRLLIRNAEDG